PQDVSEMEVRMSGRELALEAPADDEDAFAPISYLSDEGRDEPTSILERRAHDQLQGPLLEQALDTLDARSRHIVQARWLQVEGGATLTELAQEYGISAERVRQIEAAAFKKLRAVLQG